MATFTGAVGTTGWFDFHDSDPGQADNVRTTNWDTSPDFPTTGSSISINGYTVTGGVGTYSSLDLSVGSSLSGGFTFTGPFNNAGALLLSSNTLTYSGTALTNSGTITLNGKTDKTFADAQLRIAGSVTIGGGGTGGQLILADGIKGAIVTNQDGQTATLTNLTGHSIVGSGSLVDHGYSNGGSLALVNNGVVNANVNGVAITLSLFGGLSNNALMEATGGGVLSIRSMSLINSATGTLTAGNGSAIYLDGALLRGSIDTTGTGVVHLTGGGTTFDGSSSKFTTSASILQNDIDANTRGASLTLKGQVTNNGVINDGGSYLSPLVIDANGVTLSGTGEIVNPYIEANGQAATLTNTSTIAGFGTIAAHQNGALSVVNVGTVNASDATNTLNIANFSDSSAAFTNTGLLEGTGVAGLAISSSNIGNRHGTIFAASGSSVVLDSATIYGGALSSAGSGAILLRGDTTLNGIDQGAITSSATIDQQNSATITGSFQNNGTYNVLVPYYYRFALDAATLTGNGRFVLNDSVVSGAGFADYGNTISGRGTINTTVDLEAGTIDANVAGATLALTNSQAVINNGTLQADGGTLTVASGVTGTGSVAIANGGAFVENASNFNQNIAFSGAGSATLSAGGDGVVHYAGVISGFGVGDTLIFSGASYGAGDFVSFAGNGSGTGGTLRVKTSAGAIVALLQVKRRLPTLAVYARFRQRRAEHCRRCGAC